MLSEAEIKAFIDADSKSRQKQFAKVGVRYYEGNHDIRDYRIFFIDAEGKIQEDKTKSKINCAQISRFHTRFSGCWLTNRPSICFPVTAAL